MFQLFQLDMQLYQVCISIFGNRLFGKCLVSSQLLLCAFLDVIKCCAVRSLFVIAYGMSLSILPLGTNFCCRATVQVVCVFIKAMLANSVVQTNGNKTVAFWSVMLRVWIFSFKQTL